MSLKIKYVPVFVKNVKATTDFLITKLDFKNSGTSLIFDNNTCILLKNEDTDLMLGVFERQANDNYMNLIVLNTADCLKDYHKLRSMGINFLSTRNTLQWAWLQNLPIRQTTIIYLLKNAIIQINKMGYLKVLSNNNRVHSNVASQRYQKPQTGDLSLKFALNGEEKYSLGRRQLSIHPDSFLLINKGTEFTSTVDSLFPVESFAIDFDQKFLQDFLNCLTLKNNQLLDQPANLLNTIDFDETIYPFKGDISYNIKHLKRHLDAGLQDELLINEYLHHSLVNYYNIYNTEIVKKSENLVFLNTSTKVEILRRLNLAKEYMLSNYNSSIDLDMIAKHSCLSVNHFLRTFKQAYSQSPYQFLTQVRLQRARLLLKSTDYSVNEIVSLVGFECSSSFIRLFKSKYQITPSRFKISA